MLDFYFNNTVNWIKTTWVLVYNECLSNIKNKY